MKHPILTIVIPAYREEKRIANTLDQLATYLKDDEFFKEQEIEVLVVAADAPDSTKQIVLAKQELFKNLKLLSPGPQIGKGRDVQYGMLRATGHHVVFMDADLATPLHHLKEFYLLNETSNDIVIGTRNLLTYRADKLRGIFSLSGNLIYRFFSGTRVEDTQCGFKMFTAKTAKLCFSKQTIMGWGFDIEILAIAKANKLKIQTIRINDWQHMPYSTYMDGALRITLRSIRDFCHVGYRRFIGSYN